MPRHSGERRSPVAFRGSGFRVKPGMTALESGMPQWGAQNFPEEPICITRTKEEGATAPARRSVEGLRTICYDVRPSYGTTLSA